MQRLALLVALIPMIPCEGLAQAPATKGEIEAAFPGRTALFHYGAEAKYEKDGSYTYSDRSGVYRGKYTILDGSICVVFTTNDRRCDGIAREGNGFVLINRGGQRFPLTFQ